MSGICHLSSPDPAAETVVLVHGLLRRSGNMMPLARRLHRAGFSVYVYDYATAGKSIAAHGVDFKRFLEPLVTEQSVSRLHIVSHSMGGIITRVALGHLAPGGSLAGEVLKPERLGRVVMLAPPNGGSDIPRLTGWLFPFIGRFIVPLPELSSAPDAFVHRVPVPQGIDIGIIAGRFDGKVRVCYTFLPGMRHHLVINSEHMFMVYWPFVAALVIRYLRRGSFQDCV